jgi:uncharacterized repeat protein (TIGR02543 family)
METRIVHFRATPVGGVCASEPLFINRAWVNASDTLHIPTGNSTYHQGAGVCLATFSTGVGGDIFHARPQALDYKTSPGQGILIVPDEGFRFAGWSHDDYRSMRGERIAARSGIMRYDTLTVFGSLDLQAHFIPEEYEITYFLNGGVNRDNPPAYNITSQTFTLEIPEKVGDEFTGWTGSNGDEPQKTVTIPKGSTGERIYYANYLHSGREETTLQPTQETDSIRVYQDELHVYTTHAGSVIRIFTPDGVLHRVHVCSSVGETSIKLRHGMYIVSINNNAGKKIMIIGDF